MVSPFFIKCSNQDFTRGCYNRPEAGVSPMGSFEAYLLIVSSTIALFWLAVRSEIKRSLYEDESAGSVAGANPGGGGPALP
jgi:hypothetical protein